MHCFQWSATSQKLLIYYTKYAALSCPVTNNVHVENTMIYRNFNDSRTVRTIVYKEYYCLVFEQKIMWEIVWTNVREGENGLLLSYFILFSSEPAVDIRHHFPEFHPLPPVTLRSLFQTLHLFHSRTCLTTHFTFFLLLTGLPIIYYRGIFPSKRGIICKSNTVQGTHHIKNHLRTILQHTEHFSASRCI